MESRQTIIKFLSGKYEDITSGIYSGSSQLIEILDDGEQLDFKGCNANSFEAKIANLTDKMIVGEKISVCQNIGTEEVQLFTGIIDTAELQTDKTYRKVVAYDELYSKAAVNITLWYNNFFTGKSNVTLKSFRDELFAYIGIEQVETTLINDEMIVNQTATGVIKFGDMVANICEINGVFGNINRYGKFEYIDLNNTAKIDITENLRSNGKIQDYEVIQISSVELYTDKESNRCVVGSGNSFIVNGNSLLYEKTYSELQEIANNLLAKVKNISYTPVDINTVVSDLNITPGTKITFTTRSGKIISAYAMRNKLSGVQMFKQNIIANGDKARSATVNNTDSELDVLRKAMIMKLDAYEASLTYATITSLEAIDVEVKGKVSANELEGKVASFGYMTVDTANLLYATIPELDSVKADIDEVNSLITNTNTLIFGSASGGTIQTSFSNSVIAQLGDAQIESAMIKEISALKITGLDLNTTKLRVHSEDGLSYWEDNTICIHDGVLGTPRIQIGKDGSGDYNMYIWNSSGKLMFDALGLTENGISRQIIRNDVVKDDADINAAKLNLESLFGVINNDTSYTLKSSKIFIDEEGQTLDVSFKVISSNVSDLQSTLSTQGTEITTLQGYITQKIWKQDITTAIDDIEVGGRNLQLGTQNWTDLLRIQNGAVIEGEVLTVPKNIYVDCNFIEVAKGEEITISIDAYCDEVKNNAIILLQWYNKAVFDELSTERIYFEYLSADVTEQWHRYRFTVTVPEDIDANYLLVGLRARDAGKMYFRHLKVERGTKSTDWTIAPEDIDAEFVSMTTQYSELLQDLNGFKFTVSNTYTTLNILRNCNKYTEINKLKLTANKDNYFEITDIEVELIKGEQYTFSCDTDGIWGTGTDDTVEAYLLLNGSYETYFRVEDKYPFIALETGKYILRLDVNKNGCTHYFWNIMLEKGSVSTDWKPNLTDLDITSESTKTIATQTADKFSWIVASGTSSTDFTLTDRMAELTAEIISLNGNVKVSGDMLVDGAITADKLATDAIMSRNYVTNTTGSYLNLEDGSFKSKYLSWDKNGKFNAKSGEIGKWSILTGGGLMAETNTGTAPGTLNRVYLQPFNNTDYEDTWVISSQYDSIDSSGNPEGKASAYWYITGAGDFFTEGNIGCNTFLANFETAGNILFTKKRFGTSSAGTDYCYWITPCTDSIDYDEAIFYGGYKEASNTEEAYYPLWYITLDGTSGFETVSAGTYNNVSDRNKKHDIVNLNEQQCIDVICALNPVSFKFNNTEYQRNHWGFVAQDVESALENLNISWQDFAVVDKTLHKTETMPGEKVQNSEETYDYYLRYEAFIAPMVAMEQNHEKRIQQLENDLAVANAIIQSLLLQNFV